MTRLSVTASAFIYLVRPRPAWRSKHTLAEFYLTGALLGPFLAVNGGLGARQWLITAIVSADAKTAGAAAEDAATSQQGALIEALMALKRPRSPALEHSKLKCLYAALKKKQIFAVGGDIQQRSAIDPTKRM